MAFANIDAGFNGAVSDNTFKEILAQRFDLAVIEGGRMFPPSADTGYYAGAVLAQYTSGPNAGLYVPVDSANSSATDGSAKAIGVLLKDAFVGASGSPSEIQVVVSGLVYSDLCYTYASGVVAMGMSDAVVTALSGTRLRVHGQNEVKF